MTTYPSKHTERGAVLVVGLIVLMLITLMVTAAFKFSTYNLKAVGNMQSHNEAIAAANKAIEQVIGSWDFRSAPTADEISVDIDNNGTFDYTVTIDPPRCVKAIAARVAGSKGDDCNDQLNALQTCNSGLAAATTFNVVWDVPATATSTSGASVRVRQGVSLSMSKAQCTAACPPAPGLPCA